MDLEVVLAIIVTAIVTLGAVFVGGFLDERKRVKQIKRDHAKLIIEEISIVSYYLQNQMEMIEESSDLVSNLEDKDLSSISLEDYSESIGIMSRYMIPKEIMEFIELFETDPSKGMAYLFALFFNDMKQFRTEIINIRQKSSGFSLYFSEVTSTIVRDELENFYQIIDDIDVEDPSSYSIDNLVDQLDPIVDRIRDALKEEIK